MRSTSSPPLKSLGFLPGSGRIFASGKGYAAVWDMVSAEVRRGFDASVGGRIGLLYGTKEWNVTYFVAR